MKKFLACLFIWAFVSPAWAVNVAVIAPKAEDMARFGHDLVGGVRTAVEMINENGGILGEYLTLIEIEDRCLDKAEVSTAKMISSASSPKEKISLVIGPYCNNAFEEVSDLYAKGKVVHITPMPLTLAQISHKARGLFKIGETMEGEAEAFYAFYKNAFADKNLAMVYDRTLPQTVEAAMTLQQLFEKAGLSNKMTLYDLSAYSKDYVKLAKEILLNNQAVYLLGDTKSIAKTAQRLQEQDEHILLFTDEYLATGYFFKEMGNFVEGVYLMALENLKDHPEFTEDLVRLRLLGKEPSGLGVYGYAAVNLWKDMVEKAGTLDFDKLVETASQGAFVLPWGEVLFIEGAVSKNAGYRIYQIKNGEYAQVN